MRSGGYRIKFRSLLKILTVGLFESLVLLTFFAWIYKSWLLGSSKMDQRLNIERKEHLGNNRKEFQIALL